jgi:hypothetical protein
LGLAEDAWKASSIPLRLRRGMYAFRYTSRVRGAEVFRYRRGKSIGRTAGSRGGMKAERRSRR